MGVLKRAWQLAPGDIIAGYEIPVRRVMAHSKPDGSAFARIFLVDGHNILVPYDRQVRLAKKKVSSASSSISTSEKRMKGIRAGNGEDYRRVLAGLRKP
jgi:hypothetical protein